MDKEPLKVREVVEYYLQQTGLTLKGFGQALSECIIPDGGIALSHVTILNWRDGNTEPTIDMLTLILIRYRDWRFDFAAACLAAKRPEVWGTGSELGDMVMALKSDALPMEATPCAD